MLSRFEAPPPKELELEHIIAHIEGDMDLWRDARMDEVLTYIRGSKNLPSSKPEIRKLKAIADRFLQT